MSLGSIGAVLFILVVVSFFRGLPKDKAISLEHWRGNQIGRKKKMSSLGEIMKRAQTASKQASEALHQSMEESLRQPFR